MFEWLYFWPLCLTNTYGDTPLVIDSTIPTDQSDPADLFHLTLSPFVPLILSVVLECIMRYANSYPNGVRMGRSMETSKPHFRHYPNSKIFGVDWVISDTPIIPKLLSEHCRAARLPEWNGCANRVWMMVGLLGA